MSKQEKEVVLSPDAGHRDSKTDEASGAEQHERNEATAGMKDLAKDRKQMIEFLKQGGRSGISFYFRKPEIVDLQSYKVPGDWRRVIESNKMKIGMHEL